MTDWYGIRQSCLVECIDLVLVWNNHALHVIYYWKGVFVKSYIQARSHSYLIDVVIYKMFIFPEQYICIVRKFKQKSLRICNNEKWSF